VKTDRSGIQTENVLIATG